MDEPDLPHLQRLIANSPYLRWLGLEPTSLSRGAVEARARWREDWVANPDLGQTQGGVLASLVDFAASFALFVDLGAPAVTVDLRVDYHRLARRGDLVAQGSVIRRGRRISVCEARVGDLAGRLVASGRGTFLSEG